LQRTGLALLLVLLLPALLTAAEVVELAGSADVLSVEIIESTPERTIIEYALGSFTRDRVIIDGEAYDTVSLGGESKTLERGFPALPDVSRSIIIPDDAEMSVRVVSSHHVDLDGFRVAPSKGKILRNVDPRTVAYAFDPIYESGDWYPSQLAAGREPYIMRDHRGMVVVVSPFQHNPASRTLRVYDRLTVEVAPAGPGRANVLERRTERPVNTEFRKIYERHFLNFEQASRVRYTSVDEIGDMLVIAHGDFMTAMQPLVEWKNQMGVACEMVSVADAGGSSGAIQTYIQNYYDTHGLTYVLLVGDGAEVPTPYAAGGSSDPTYSLVAGGDSYPDIFVGRFSAESVSHVETQVLRTIRYEKFPDAGAAWYHKGTGLASNQGPGDDNEYDDDHVDNIRDDLLGFTYTEVDRIYDPQASATMVSNALNDGRSVINYTGHGSTMGWSSSNFSNSHVNALTNDGMLPFVFSVACVNGYFNGLTCFAEVWLRATHGSEPTGAIGTYMSSINQSWDPPMAAQDESTDLLVAGAKRTFGGLCYNGSALMMDEYSWDGEEMFLTWHIFGDPSLRVRTDTPVALAVTHNDEIDASMETLEITVDGVEGALCALYLDGVLYGSALTDADGVADVPIGDPPTGEDLTVTVTAFNSLPHFGTVYVGQSFVPAINVTPGFFDVIMEPYSVHTDTLYVHNLGEPLSVLSFTVDIVDAGVSRSIDGSTMAAVPTSYAPGALGDFVFSVTNLSEDEQWIDGASIDFPPGVLVLGSSDFEVEDRQLIWDGAMGDGAHVTWSGSWSSVVYPGETATATISLAFVAGLFGVQELQYVLDGDSWSLPPDSVGGTILLDGPAGPSVTVTSPNGGELWGTGEIHDITWMSAGEFGDVSIECSADGGSSWLDIAGSTPNDGVHPWLVDVVVTNECVIRVTAVNDPPVADESDGVFSVYEPVFWLRAVPASGDVPSGETLAVVLEFDSADLSQGDYYADILIGSNGGERITVPVALHVSGTSVDESLPRSVTIYGSYPNPFNPTTSVAFALPEPTRVAISIYDVGGRLVRALTDEAYAAGRHSVPWDGRNDRGEDVTSGIYFFRFEAAGRSSVGKMTLLK